MKEAGRQVKGLYGVVTAIGLALGALPLRAEAADPIGYVGAGLGLVNSPSADGTVDGTSFDGTDTSLFAGSIYGGARLNEVVAIEVGYMKSANGDVKIGNVDTGRDYGVTTLYGAVVARIPTDGDLKPFAKLGMHRWDIDVSVESGGVRSSASVDGTDLLFGGGVDLELAESWTIRAEYMYLPYSEGVADGKAHTFLVGVNRSF